MPIAAIVLRRQSARVDAAQRHLGLVVAERPGRQHAARRCRSRATSRSRAVAELAQRPRNARARRTTAARSASADARRADWAAACPMSARERNQASASIPGSRSIASGVAPSQYDEICRIAGPDRPRCVKSRFSRKRPPSQVTSASTDTPDRSPIARERVGREGERHQRGPRRHDGETELLGDPVSERRRADLGNRETARRDRRATCSAPGPARSATTKASPSRSDAVDRARHAPGHAAALALRLQHAR